MFHFLDKNMEEAYVSQNTGKRESNKIIKIKPRR
jgi:hypothetical protein